MADQLFQDSPSAGPVGTTAEIPDIFDVLEGGEDEGTVRFLLGFNGEDAGVSLLGGVDGFSGMEGVDKYVADDLNINMTNTYLPPISHGPPPPPTRSPVIIRQAQSSMNKKRDTSGSRAIHNCDSCGKSFTTKFNLKRHINMHCHKSKENGVPVQGPPSASAPAKKDGKVMETQLSPIRYQPGIRPTHPQIHVPQTTTQVPTANLPPHQTLIHNVQYPDLTNNNNQNEYTSRILLPVSSPVVTTQDYTLPEPDTTYRLPSVQTLLPVSTVYTLSKAGCGVTCYNTMPTSESSPLVTSATPMLCVTASGHNTDYGTLPADLFEPDSSRSGPPTPTSTSHSWQDGPADSDNPVSPFIMLTSVPPGWTRRVIIEHGYQCAKYFSPLGKRFSSFDEISQYFNRMNYTVPKHLFKFTVDENDDSESEDDLVDSEDDDSESVCAKRRKSDIHEDFGELGAPWSPAPSGSSLSPRPPTSTSPIASSIAITQSVCTVCPTKHQPVCTVCPTKMDPIFHIVPPKRQKIYQSEAYIRYIEGLSVESTSMCDWKKELSSTKELMASYSMEEDIRIPAWLDKIAAEENSSSLDSLFALRDFMLQEALSVVKFA